MQNTAPFTLKHVMRDGSVGLYAARAIMTTVAKAPTPPPDELETLDIYEKQPTRVEFDMGDGSGVRGSIATGVVYVLNQNGKTVETFRFPREVNEDPDMATGLAIRTDEDDERDPSRAA